MERAVRKRLVIVGNSDEGIELVPMLESNPNVEVLAVITEQPDELHERLAALDPATAGRVAALVSTNLQAALDSPNLTAVIDAGVSSEMREKLESTPGLQITTPVLAQLLYAFGPADALSRVDLLQALREVLDSYNLTLDRRELLGRVLQIAVTVTGADRGSLMLWDEHERALRVSVSKGIEEELIPKIRVGLGEGIAGRAFAAQRAILLHGKADRTRYDILRERDDVESAISAPLMHEGKAIGVLNLSHARDQEAFDQEDLCFVRDLARLDAKLIARADVYHGLLEESEALRVEVEVRRLVAGHEPLSRRFEQFCSFAASAVPGAICRLYLHDPQLDALLLQASSSGLDPLTTRRRVAMSEGVAGHVAALRKAVRLRDASNESPIAHTALPMLKEGEFLGVLELEGGSARSEPHGPSGRLAVAAAALANQLTEIVEAARAARQNRRSESAAELFAALALQGDREQSYDLVTSSTAAILEAEDVVLRVLEPSSGMCEIVSWSGVEQSRHGRAEALEAELSSKVIERGSAIRIADLASDPNWAARSFGVASAMSHPLQRQGELVGCLTVLGLVPAEPVLGQTFQRADATLLARLVLQVQLALFAQTPATAARCYPAAGFRARIEEEIGRSRHAGRQFYLLQLSFEGLDAVLEGLSQAESDRWIEDLQGVLAGGLRSFDVLERSGTTSFRALVPDPDGDAATQLVVLSQRASEMLGAAGPAAEQVRIRTGYATFPGDGDDVDSLERRAAATAEAPRP